MARKIWKRSHEESRISLRQEFMPDSSEHVPPLLPPELSYQDIRPVGYTYASRPVIRNMEEAERAICDYRKAATDRPIATYSSISEMYQAMEMQALDDRYRENQERRIIIETRNI
jgi:hypothetical protein